MNAKSRLLCTVLLLSCAACTDAKKEPSQKATEQKTSPRVWPSPELNPPAKADFVLKPGAANAIVRDLHENKVAALRKYQGKVIEFEMGAVSSIDERDGNVVVQTHCEGPTFVYFPTAFKANAPLTKLERKKLDFMLVRATLERGEPSPYQGALFEFRNAVIVKLAK